MTVATGLPQLLEGVAEIVSGVNNHSVSNFDLRDPPPGFVDDPFPWYEALRSDAPIRRLPDASVLVTGYEACAEIYRSDAFLSDKRSLFQPKFGESPLYEHHTTSLVFNDPPYHSRVRPVLVEALKPRTIQSTVEMLTSRVTELLTELREQGELGVGWIASAFTFAAISPDATGLLRLCQPGDIISNSRQVACRTMVTENERLQGDRISVLGDGRPQILHRLLDRRIVA